MNPAVSVARKIDAFTTNVGREIALGGHMRTLLNFPIESERFINLNSSKPIFAIWFKLIEFPDEWRLCLIAATDMP